MAEESSNATNTQTGADKSGAVADQQQQDQQGDQQQQEATAQVFTFTQEALTERLRRADEATVKRLLGELGVEDFETAKAKVAAATQAEEANKTELEKAAGRIEQLEKKLADAEAALAQAQQQRANDALDAAIRGEAKDAIDPQDVVRWARQEVPEMLEGALDEAGNVDSAKVQALVKACRDKKAHYFSTAQAGKGSPSNSNGRVAEPNKDVKARLRQELRNQVRF